MDTFRIVSTPFGYIIVNEKTVMQYMVIENDVYPHVFFSDVDAADYLNKYILKSF